MSDNFRDGYLDRKTEFGSISTVVQLVADGQAIVLDAGQGLLRLTSNNTTATNRTFTISDGNSEGQKLVIILESGASTTCELLSTGNVKLTATWTPLQWNALQLVWNGTFWIEDTRNNGSSVIAGAVANAAVPSPVTSAQGVGYVQATVNAGFDAKADQVALTTLQTTVNNLLISLRAAGILAP